MSSLRETCVDEVQPLRNGDNHSPAISAFSSVSVRKPDYTRRCVVFMLLLTIILLAVFVAFLIGTWMSEERMKNDQKHAKLTTTITPLVPGKISAPLASLTELGPEAITGTAHTVLLTTVTTEMLPTVTLTDGRSQPRIVERLIPLENTLPRRNTSVYDVYPSSLEVHDFIEELHASRTAARKKTDSLLVPLPQHLLPLHYDLLLDLSRFSVDRFIRGNLTITLDSNGSSDDEILFHVGPNVNIERVRIRRNDKRVFLKMVKREDNKKLARLMLKERLMKGKYYLDLEFNTTICDDNDEGGVHCLLEGDVKLPNATRITSFTTKFEPTLARSFMPCWDEPAIKATFNISVLHAAKYTVLSNMPPIEADGRVPVEFDERIIETRFQETPPMSTYLLAFAVGEFLPYEMRTERNIPITVWTLREDFLSARFAANFSPVMFDRHEDELEVPYPLPKMDFVAAHSFPVGGMENWGLVVFDHQALLFDPVLEEADNMTIDRLYHEYKIEKIITHELAHQWFGNLVTMKDWSDLWLNEGFASYMVHSLLQNDHPHLTDHEYHTRMAKLIRKQSGQERNPLVQDLATESAVEQSFHATHLYTKGCVLVRMIRDLVSKFDFDSGIKRYLRRNAFRSVSRDDLWASLPAYADHGAENERLSQVMEGWLINQGIPEVTITRNYDNDMIQITQSPADEQKHRAFLQDKSKNKIVRRQKRAVILPRLETSTLSSELEGTTPFDESLFEDIKQEDLSLLRKNNRKQKRKRKKNHKNHHHHHLTSERMLADASRVTVEARREELRSRRKAGAPSDLWSIPFSYMFGSVKSTEGQMIFEVIRQFWLKNQSISFADLELPPSQPLLANPDWSYPYRVNYDNNNWKMIAKLLHQNHREIPANSRMQLIVDAETFLGQSDLPHLYIYILGYLAQETDMGVSLLGLDAIYRLVDSWRGSSISNSLLIYLSPVVAQLDQLLIESQSDTELAAIWLIEPSRLSKLYQLRCATNLQSCDQDEQTRRWLSQHSSFRDDVHRQSTGVCHFLFTNKATQELIALEQQLKSRGAQWTTAVQLAACSQDERTVKLAAKQIAQTRNAAIYASSLQSDFSLHYNERFRHSMWHQIGRLTLEERRLLFSINETVAQPASKILLHSVRTVEELHQVRSLVPDWSGPMAVHLDYVERQMQWTNRMAHGVLRDFFNGDTFI